jgi:hypothetical protein
MGDGLSTINGFLQNLSLICAVTSTHTGRANKIKIFFFFQFFQNWTFLNYQRKSHRKMRIKIATRAVKSPACTR